MLLIHYVIYIWIVYLISNCLKCHLLDELGVMDEKANEHKRFNIFFEFHPTNVAPLRAWDVHT